MAPVEPEWGFSKALVCSLLVLLCMHTATGMSGWNGCYDGQDVIAVIRENSQWGEVVAEIMAETTMEGVYWSLEGRDADWFFLDEGSIRLNTSADKVLDREAQGPFLMAELSCYDDDTLQSVYRIMVEILNENDNSPVFAEDTVQSLVISELTPVNAVVFTVQATDADDDKIIYTIDQDSPDADYFKVDLPNSGEVILSRPLDYETKALLSVTIHASEMSTAEHLNTSTDITITVLDADDQYPQFLPCMLLFTDETSRICTSPVYTVNVTEGEEDIVLDFFPGPIHAVDGDIGLSTAVSYAILSGDDDGRFLMDRETGEMTLIQGVRDRLTTPELRLHVMAYQDDDHRKYSVAIVLVRILAVNHFHPEFDMAEYKGFVIAGHSTASLVNTYGSKALMLHVRDQDFNPSFNPMIYFTISSTSNHTDIYQITQDGLLIAKTNQLKPKQRHRLTVTAIDRESGEATFATVVVEVLFEGQSIPYSAFGADRLSGCTMGKAFLLSMVFLAVIGCTLAMLMWLKKKHKGKRDPLQRGCVAQGKHPNVSLRWFQLSHRNAMPPMEEPPHSKEEYGTYNPSFSMADKPGGTYTHQEVPPFLGHGTASAPGTLSIPTKAVHSPVILNTNVTTPTKSWSSSLSLNQATVDVNPTCTDQDNTPTENPVLPTDTSPEPTEATRNASPSPSTHDSACTPPLTCPDLQTSPPTPTNEDSPDLVTSPSSQSSIPCSNTRIASAEIDKPFRKPRVKTPPHSPLGSSPLSKHTEPSTPTSAHAPFRPRVIIITSPLVKSITPGTRTSIAPSTAEDQPSTSLDQAGQVCCRVGDWEDDGFLGDNDADKNSGDDNELEADDEELLRVMARCKPIFLTYTTK